MDRRDSESSAVSYWKSIGVALPQSVITTISTQPFRNVQILQQTTPRVGGMNPFLALQILGLQGSYKGMIASTMKLALQNALFNPALLFSDRLLTPEFSAENPLTSACVKSLFSTLSKIAVHPIDVVITQAISQERKTHEAFKQMSQEFHSKPTFLAKIGVGYRGVIPEAVKQVIGNGCLFLIKDQINQAKELCGFEKNMDQELSVLDMMFSGLIIATMKNIITHPADTVAKVIQSKHANTIGEAFDVLKKRAIEADATMAATVYRGFVPKTAASAVVAAATIAMLEYCKEPSRSSYR